MSNRKFVVHRTSTLTGKPVIYFAATLAVAFGALTPTPVNAQSATEIYKKMSDVYATAKSFQGTIVRSEKVKTKDGKLATQMVSVKINFKAPNKYLVTNTKAVNVGGKSQTSSQAMVTDGKTLYMYSPDRKLYQRGQVPTENMLSRFFSLLNPVNGFALLTNSNLNGRAVFVLAPNLPTKGTPAEIANAKKVKISLLIDKQNYQFLKMTIDSPNGNLVETISGQAVNGAVSDSVFVWTPPASYKEFKPPTNQGGAGVPGRIPGQ